MTESEWGLAMSAGWVLGYCLYEALHWLFHSGDPERGLGRFWPVHTVRDAHLVHHLHRANKNYGFSTMFWDKVFGTYLPLDQIQIRRPKIIYPSPAAKISR